MPIFFSLLASIAQLLPCRIPTFLSLYLLDFYKVQTNISGPGVQTPNTSGSGPLILLPEVSTVAPCGLLPDISIRWRMCLGPDKQKSRCPSCKTKWLKLETLSEKERPMQATLQVLRRLVSQAPLYFHCITCPHLFGFKELGFNY